MGHETSHAFDDQVYFIHSLFDQISFFFHKHFGNSLELISFGLQGAKYNWEGNLVRWWTNQSYERFENQTSCMVDEYGKFVVDGQHEKKMSELCRREGGCDLCVMCAWRTKKLYF